MTMTQVQSLQTSLPQAVAAAREQDWTSLGQRMRQREPPEAVLEHLSVPKMPAVAAAEVEQKKWQQQQAQEPPRRRQMVLQTAVLELAARPPSALT